MIVISYEAFQLIVVTSLVFALMISMGALRSITMRLLAERRHREGLVLSAEQKWHRRKRGNTW
jgi:hypothetical protein